jgi:hypothetical protein
MERRWVDNQNAITTAQKNRKYPHEQFGAIRFPKINTIILPSFCMTVKKQPILRTEKRMNELPG